MASGDLTAHLEAYVADFAARLRGPRRSRERATAEVRDGLSAAVDARLRDGMKTGAAFRAALTEFGDPTTVVRAFAAELATASARRVVAALILTGPLVGVWWLFLYHAEPWRNGVAAAVIAIPALPLVGLAIAAAAGTFATTGRLIRWLPEAAPERALAAATVVAALSIIADATVLGLLAVQLAAGIAHPAALATIAATASLARIGGSTAAIRLCRATRVALRVDESTR